MYKLEKWSKFILVFMNIMWIFLIWIKVDDFNLKGKEFRLIRFFKLIKCCILERINFGCLGFLWLVYCSFVVFCR